VVAGLVVPRCGDMVGVMDANLVGRVGDVLDEVARGRPTAHLRRG
jgi:hypothetical protein